MRISLLLEREPFAEILQNTLATHLQRQTGETHTVRWKTKTDRIPGGACTRMLVNAKLNIIFSPRLHQSAFAPTRREFSRSTVFWRRPLQRLYVHAATRRPLSRLLSHAQLTVTPVNRDLEKLLIIPGNHKIRLLDQQRQTCTSILKSGFRDDALRAEIAARTIALELKIPVPQTLDSNSQAGWFRETYVCGTPLNRVADATQRERSFQEAMGHMGTLVTATVNEQPVDPYWAATASRIHDRLDRYSSDNPQTVTLTQEVVRRLLHRIAELAKSGKTSNYIGIAMTHGDFQPANILLNEQGIWIIDWENSRERQASYDWLVWTTRSRQGKGRVARWMAALEDPQQNPPAWTGIDWTRRDTRLFCLSLFMLEELDTRVSEVSHPALKNLASDYVRLVNEVKQWIDRTAA